jgi:hypothetical protein
MLEAIFAKLGGAFLDRIFGGILDISKAVINKQITEIDAKKQLLSLFISGWKDVEVEHSKDLVETYRTFWTAADSDKTNLMKIMWAAALGSQIWVLFWAQWVAPFLYAYGLMDKGWHAGGTTDWSYALVGALLGLGPMVLRTGPTGGSITDKLKALISGK